MIKFLFFSLPDLAQTISRLQDLMICLCSAQWLNTLKWKHSRYSTDNIYSCIFLTKKCCILIKFSVKFAPKGSVGNKMSLGRLMARHLVGTKSLSTQWQPSSLTHTVKCHNNACHYNANASLTWSILGSQTAPPCPHDHPRVAQHMS